MDLVLRQGPRENVAQEHVSDKLLCCAGVFVGNAPRRAVMKRFLVFSRSVASFSTSSIVWSLTSSVFVVAWKGCACARACVRERERGGAISRAERAVSVPARLGDARARAACGRCGLRGVWGAATVAWRSAPPSLLGVCVSVIRRRFTSKTAFELSLSFFQAAVLPSSSFLTVTCGRGEGAVTWMERGCRAVAAVWARARQCVPTTPRFRGLHGGGRRSCLLAVVAHHGALEEHCLVLQRGVLDPHGRALRERHVRRRTEPILEKSFDDIEFYMRCLSPQTGRGVRE